MKRHNKIIIGAFTAIIIAITIAACGIHKKHSDPEKHLSYMVEKITDELILNDAQSMKLDALKNTLLNTYQEAKQSRTSAHQEIETLISQPTLDQTQLLELVTQKTEKINDKAPEVISAIANFYDSLDSQQQATILEKYKEHQEGGSRFCHH